MITYIDNLLNRITMYRLVLYYLVVLIFLAFVFGFLGWMPYEPTSLAFSILLILLVSLVTNWTFSRIFEVPTNTESVYITALIIALIVTPVTVSDYVGVGAIIFISIWAVASKYIFAIGRKHIFNPVAFAVVASALLLNAPATWWVGGNIALLPFVLLGGLLIVRKIRRFDLILSFSVASLTTIIVTSYSGSFIDPIVQTLLHSSFFFLAFVMLTEPLTTPPTMKSRVIYGLIVGLLFAPNIHIGTFYLTPEIALIIGNIYSYIVSPKGRYKLTLKAIEKKANDTYDFKFISDKKISFMPGQYLEWTLGHKYPDNRGNRRHFTIASAPTESSIRLGVKFYTPYSTFKRTLGAMKKGSIIFASQLSGNFILPRNKKTKLVFIAGGIGITPFRSMLHFLLDKKESRDIQVLYTNRTPEDVAYKDILDRAHEKLGIKTLYFLSDEKNIIPNMINGLITPEIIIQEIPDYSERMFYISGPHGMVKAFKKTLLEMGIPRRRIKSDFFPGFA